jgi:5-formyltetrahydrofolate cyclo-ligase
VAKERRKHLALLKIETEENLRRLNKENRGLLGTLNKMNDVLATKKRIRQEISRERERLTDKQCLENSQCICDMITKSALIKDSDDFILYYPFQNEVDLLPCAEFLLKNRKNIYFPRFNLTSKSYDLAIIKSLEKDFVKGKFGIMEPSVVAEGVHSDFSQAVWFIPGVAFDKKGNRLGRGGGYYDRFLNSHKGTFVAVAHQIQLVEQVPLEAHDMKVDWLVTEKNIYKLTVD